MWLPDEPHILFKMKTEGFITLDSPLYQSLSTYIDLHKWKDLYKKKYNEWLNNDQNFIYHITDEVNLAMINVLISMNNDLKSKRIFYWFDIDRTFNENFIWEYCPISKKRLITLPAEYPKINSLISPDYPIVFPLN